MPKINKVPYENFQQLFEKHLNRYLVSTGSRLPAQLYEPERYMLGLGGKRVRPLLCLIGCDFAGGKVENSLDSALAVEIFHNFSLIHDDILDQAPLRRSQPTAHKKFGLNLAILGGDAMLVRAFSCLQFYPADKFSELTKLLQKTAIEVCEGQQLDMNFEKQDHVAVEDYIAMIRLKTAVLLGCSLEMGAVCADASPRVREALNSFGIHLGIAFQLLDDMLDCFPSKEQFGKQKGGDIVSNKKTFLWLKALSLASASQRVKLRELAALGEEAQEEKISATTAIFRELGTDNLCREEADRHTQMAIMHLEGLNAPQEKKDNLRNFALKLLGREK